MRDLKTEPNPPKTRAEWSKILAPYRKSSDLRGAFEVGISAVLFVAVWFLMYRSLAWGYHYTLGLAVLEGLLMSRLFALQHEMSHRSVFATRWMNDVVGSIIGVLTITPHFYWRRTHAYHHATSGNLDERKFGDIDTWTVREYEAATPLERFGYRALRNPLILLTIGAAYQFGLKHRWPSNIPTSWRKEWKSVHGTNLAMLLGTVAMGEWIGYAEFFMIQIPILCVAAPTGVWLFYMQHQYEEAYWVRKPEWDYVKAALEGSSFYDLPRILHWFTANIGFHHIHHLDSAIPCYQLRRCMEAVEELQHPVSISLWESLDCGKWRLWDEDAQKMVGFPKTFSSPTAPPATP